MRGLTICLTLLAAATTVPAQQAYFPGFGGGDVTLPITSMRSAKLKSTLLQKYDFSCGSAALATLLTYHYNFPVNEQTVFEEMYAQGDQQKIHKEGFSLLDMKRYLASHGFVADGFEHQPLDKLVQARVPAIALIDENGYHHFVVIKGVQEDRVLLGDPAQGTRAMPRPLFEERWKNKLLFVIHNHMDAARFNLASDWRTVPRAPVGDGIDRGSMSAITLPKFGPGDF
jgi:uncharacterized protein